MIGPRRHLICVILLVTPLVLAANRGNASSRTRNGDSFDEVLSSGLPPEGGSVEGVSGDYNEKYEGGVFGATVGTLWRKFHSYITREDTENFDDRLATLRNRLLTETDEVVSLYTRAAASPVQDGQFDPRLWHEAATRGGGGGDRRRAKRSHPLDQPLIRDADGVLVLERVEGVASLRLCGAHDVQMIKWHERLLVTLIDDTDNVTLYTINTRTYEVTSAPPLPGVNSCGFTVVPGDLLLIACISPKGISAYHSFYSGTAQEVTVYQVKEEAYGAGDISVIHRQKIEVENALDIEMWAQGSENYMLIVSSESLEEEVLSPFGERLTNRTNFHTSSYLYQWKEHYFDLLQQRVLPGTNPHSATHFSVDAIHFVAISNFNNNKGQHSCDSYIFRYSLDETHYVLHQRVATRGARHFASFTLGRQPFPDTFLAVANYCEDNEDYVTKTSTEASVAASAMSAWWFTEPAGSIIYQNITDTENSTETFSIGNETSSNITTPKDIAVFLDFDSPDAALVPENTSAVANNSGVKIIERYNLTLLTDYETTNGSVEAAALGTTNFSVEVPLNVSVEVPLNVSVKVPLNVSVEVPLNVSVEIVPLDSTKVPIGIANVSVEEVALVDRNVSLVVVPLDAANFSVEVPLDTTNASERTHQIMETHPEETGSISLMGELMNLVKESATDTPIQDSTVMDTLEPEITITDATVPDITITDAKVPYITITDAIVPDITITDATVPDITITDATVPDTTITDATVPDITITDATVPDITITDATVPDTPVTDITRTSILVTNNTITATSSPGTQVLDTTIPDTTIPDSTIMETEVPAVKPETTTASTLPDSTEDNVMLDDLATDETAKPHTSGTGVTVVSDTAMPEDTSGSATPLDTATTDASSPVQDSTHVTADAESTESPFYVGEKSVKVQPSVFASDPMLESVSASEYYDDCSSLAPALLHDADKLSSLQMVMKYLLTIFDAQSRIPYGTQTAEQDESLDGSIFYAFGFVIETVKKLLLDPIGFLEPLDVQRLYNDVNFLYFVVKYVSSSNYSWSERLKLRAYYLHSLLRISITVVRKLVHCFKPIHPDVFTTELTEIPDTLSDPEVVPESIDELHMQLESNNDMIGNLTYLLNFTKSVRLLNPYKYQLESPQSPNKDMDSMADAIIGVSDVLDEITSDEIQFISTYDISFLSDQLLEFKNAMETSHMLMPDLLPREMDSLLELIYEKDGSKIASDAENLLSIRIYYLQQANYALMEYMNITPDDHPAVRHPTTAPPYHSTTAPPWEWNGLWVTGRVSGHIIARLVEYASHHASSRQPHAFPGEAEYTAHFFPAELGLTDFIVAHMDSLRHLTFRAGLHVANLQGVELHRLLHHGLPLTTTTANITFTFTNTVTERRPSRR